MPTAYRVGVIAKLLLLSEGRVQVLAKEGVIPKPKRGEYDLVGSVQGYIGYLQNLASASGTPSLMEERRLKVMVERKLKEYDYLVATRNLISREEILGEFMWRVSQVKQGLWSLHRKLPLELEMKDGRYISDVLKKVEMELLENYSRPSGILREVMRNEIGQRENQIEKSDDGGSRRIIEESQESFGQV